MNPPLSRIVPRRPSPASPAGSVTATFGGGLATLRPLVRGETGPLDAVFAGMSMPSRAARYLTPVVRLTPSMRRALSDVDGHDHVAWVAEVGGEPAALARYVRVGPCTVELALEVVDAQQGLGLGAAVLDAVTTVAVVRGFRRFQATLAADNHRSLRLLSELGLAPRASEGLLEGEAELRLLSRPRVDRASVARIALARPRGDRAPAALPCGRAAGD